MNKNYLIRGVKMSGFDIPVLPAKKNAYRFNSDILAPNNKQKIELRFLVSLLCPRNPLIFSFIISSDNSHK